MFKTKDNYAVDENNRTHMMHLMMCIGGSKERLFLNDFKSWDVEDCLSKIGCNFATVTVFMHQKQNFDNAGEFQIVVNYNDFEKQRKEKDSISFLRFVQNYINTFVTEEFVVDTFVDFHDCIAL